MPFYIRRAGVLAQELLRLIEYPPGQHLAPDTGRDTERGKPHGAVNEGSNVPALGPATRRSHGRSSCRRRVMVLWGSVVTLLASLAGLVTLGSTYVLGDASALVFAMSLFTLICAMEARS